MYISRTLIGNPDYTRTVLELDTLGSYLGPLYRKLRNNLESLYREVSASVTRKIIPPVLALVMLVTACDGDTTPTTETSPAPVPRPVPTAKTGNCSPFDYSVDLSYIEIPGLENLSLELHRNSQPSDGDCQYVVQLINSGCNCYYAEWNVKDVNRDGPGELPVSVSVSKEGKNFIFTLQVPEPDVIASQNPVTKSAEDGLDIQEH